MPDRGRVEEVSSAGGGGFVDGHDDVGDAADGGETAGGVAHADVDDVGATPPVDELGTGGDVGALGLVDVVAVDLDAEDVEAVGGHEDVGEGAANDLGKGHDGPAVEDAAGAHGALVDGHGGFHGLAVEGGEYDAEVADEGLLVLGVELVEYFLMCHVFSFITNGCNYTKNNPHSYFSIKVLPSFLLG